MRTPTHVIGDVHGHKDVLLRLLECAGLTENGHWSGGDAWLLLMGDLFNRGPDGLAVLELVMSLQVEAASAGGWVETLIGNHDVLLLAAHRFGQEGKRGTLFKDYWRGAGGVPSDLEGVNAEHAAWLSTRPALLLSEGPKPILYLHADAMFYESLGKSVTAVNQNLMAILQRDDWSAWNALLEAFSEHEAFWRPGGKRKAKRLLKLYGGTRIVHAHTPISKLTRRPDNTVTAPFHYQDGLCTDVDHALYRGGPGFVYRP